MGYRRYSRKTDTFDGVVGISIIAILAAFLAFAIGIVALLFPCILILMWYKCKSWGKNTKIAISVVVIISWILLLPSTLQLLNLSENETVSVEHSTMSSETTSVVHYAPTTTMNRSTGAISSEPTSASTLIPTPEPTATAIPTLKTGMNNGTVWDMQNRLKELGYFQAEPTGTFDFQTEIAVQEFQQKNGFEADGIADVQTIMRMYSDEAIKQVWVWVPTRGGTKYHLSESCSDMVNPTHMKIEEAEELGYERCGKRTCN